MVKKLHQSRVLKNFSIFETNLCINGLMRDHESMYVLWKILEYFDPKNILEIGFGKGQTLGIVCEVAGPKSKIVSVDISYQYLDAFTKLFPDKEVTFIEIDSKNLMLDQTFDFIIIDGNHSYDAVKKDLENCFSMLDQTGILVMDDWLNFDGVSQVVQENLLGQHGFVPFLCTSQQMFFTHVSQSKDYFLDDFLVKNAVDFVEFANIELHGFQVLKAQIYINAIFKDTNIFRSLLEFYDV
jgi:SAM-dependent methyltransferase